MLLSCPKLNKHVAILTPYKLTEGGWAAGWLGGWVAGREERRARGQVGKRVGKHGAKNCTLRTFELLTKKERHQTFFLLLQMVGTTGFEPAASTTPR